MADLNANPLAIAVRVTEILEKLGVRYLVGGSLASVAFGEPRATLDVDVAADLATDQVAPFVAAVEPGFFVDRAWVADEVARRGSFQIVHRDSMIRVDIFVPEWTGLHLWKWERRRRIEIDPETGVQFDITSPEGIVIQKLVWFRDGGEISDRQWRDVLGVLKNQQTRLDIAELRSRAALSQVADLLDTALMEAGIPRM